MEKEFEINGCMEIPPTMAADEFHDIFIGFIEFQ